MKKKIIHPRPEGRGFLIEEIVMYKINAYYLDNGVVCFANRDYALGEYANKTWQTEEEADAVADDLRDGIGDIVGSTVTYEVVEE